MKNTSYFATYDKNGEIQELFNTEKHGLNIPEPRLEISKSTRDLIVTEPSRFSVDTRKKELIDNGSPEESDDYKIDKEPVSDEISKGVEVNGVYYHIFDKDVLNLMLNRSYGDPPLARATIDGKVCVITVEPSIIDSILEKACAVRNNTFMDKNRG